MQPAHDARGTRRCLPFHFFGVQVLLAEFTGGCPIVVPHGPVPKPCSRSRRETHVVWRLCGIVVMNMRARLCVRDCGGPVNGMHGTMAHTGDPLQSFEAKAELKSVAN